MTTNSNKSSGHRTNVASNVATNVARTLVSAASALLPALFSGCGISLGQGARYGKSIRRVTLMPLVAALLLLASCATPKAEEKKAEAVPSAAPTTEGATITGKVAFTGTKPVMKDIRGQMDAVPMCVKQHEGPIYSEDVIVNSNGTLKNVFIRVKDGLAPKTYPIPAAAVGLDQKGCVYAPHVIGLMVGQNLEIANSDSTNHNIHPLPKLNREWNESQPPQSEKKVKQFLKEEFMVPIKCNVHPWMRVYVGVSSHPFFAITGEDGTFTIKGLPAGDYTLEAWHERYGVQEIKIKVGEKESGSADFNYKG